MSTRLVDPASFVASTKRGELHYPGIAEHGRGALRLPFDRHVLEGTAKAIRPLLDKFDLAARIPCEPRVLLGERLPAFWCRGWFAPHRRKSARPWTNEAILRKPASVWCFMSASIATSISFGRMDATTDKYFPGKRSRHSVIASAPLRSKSSARAAMNASPSLLREPRGRPRGLPLCPGLNRCAGLCFDAVSSVLLVFSGFVMI